MVTRLFTDTLPAKVVPPLLVIVRVPMSVPTVPVTLTGAAVLSVRLDAVPPAVPDTVARSIGVAAPAPTVSVVLSARVAGPRRIAPMEVPPTVDVPVTFRGVSLSPRVISPMPAT